MPTMTHLDVKICGLSTPETVQATVEAGASHVGFIFFEKSPRHVTPELAGELAKLAKTKSVKTVAVSVNADDATLDKIVSDTKPDILQLHGSETPDRIKALKARYGLEIWKVLAISAKDDLAKLDPYRGIADRFLLDAKPPKDSQLPGGNAVSFDWSLLTSLPENTDYLLSGGIHPGNVAQALAAKPNGLDLSSGVETAPGIKDVTLIAALFAAINKNQSSFGSQS